MSRTRLHAAPLAGGFQPFRARRTLFVGGGFLLLAVLLALLGPARPADAASHLTWIIQQPDSAHVVPGQQVRVWANSDTAFGETVGLEYNIGSTYTKVLGSFCSSNCYAGANWSVDIPATAQTTGTQVRYQLFVRNQSGSDYLFTGFNWNYTPTDIHWSGLLHDTFNSAYRSPFGPQPEGAQVTLKFRTERLNINAVTLHVYQLAANHESTTVQDIGVPYVSNDGTYDYWQTTVTLPAFPTVWYYKWKLQRGNDGPDGGLTDWYSDDYSDDHDNLHQGGTGTPAHSEPSDAFQLTVYDPNFQTPAWMQNAVVYQIFPDRFRDGDTSNDPTPNSRVFYGNITATLHTTWNEQPEDGRQTGYYNRDFFGGDLQGVIDKLDYLQSQGITAIYFTPIVQASSNHRYDTDNYEAVDPYLGNPALFQTLATQAAARGIHLILDGVYNHTSSDSLYFDRYHRYPTDGGCESLSSVFRPWYLWNNNHVPCTDGDYQGWFGYSSLAVMDKTQPAVRDYIFGASNNSLLPPGVTQNVTQFWYGLGASGFRFDVADDATFHHNYWQAFRPEAKGTASTWGKSDGPLIGEVWPDASPWLLGDELDSVMNYRFRKNILGFARYPNNWSDNDNNGTNTLVPLLPSQFDTALKSIREDYPPAAQYAMMNLIDSHDTNRALYVLRFQSETDNTLAKARLRLAATFQFTYIGAPTIYYGDEAGLYAPSQYNGPNGPEDDPYNRAPFPWDDTPGYYGGQDHALSDYYAKLAHIRNTNSALRTGDFRTLLTDDTNLVYAFGRADSTEKMVVALNNNTATVNTITIPVGGYIADGTALTDTLSGTIYVVSGGNVVISNLASKGAVILTTAQWTWAQASGAPGAALAAPGIAWDGSGNTQVFIGGNNGLEQEYSGTGTALWSSNISGAIQARAPIINVGGANRVLLTSQDGWVTLLNAADGSLYWQQRLTDGTTGLVVAGAAYQPSAGLVFAGTFTDTTPAANMLAAFDAQTGAPFWTFSGSLGLVTTRPAVDVTGNTVYFGTKDVTGGGGGHGVWAVNTTNGSLRWARTDIGGVNVGVPTVSGDGTRLYIATESGTTYRLYALSTQDGSTVANWPFTAPGGVGAFRGAPWEDGNYLYVSAGDRVYSLDKTTAAPNANWNGWQGGTGYATVPGAGAPLVLAPAGYRTLNVGANDGYFYRLNEDTGALIRRSYFGTGTVGDATYDFLRNAFYLCFGGSLYAVPNN